VDCGGLDPNVKVTVCEVHQKELNEIDFKSVIGDEIHRISDPSTKISRAFKAASGDADIRIALSGTPINASPEQIYSALNWLYPEAYPSKVKFIDRFCELTPSTWGPPTIQGILPDKEQEFFMNIDPILRRMPKSVILPFLPPVVRTRRSVEMGAKQAKAYKQMLEHKIAEVGEDDAIVAVSALTQLMRLMQFSSAYAELHEKKVHDPNSPFMDSFKTVTELKLTDPSAKIDAFMDDLPDYGDSSIVVFAQFKQLIDLLAARMDKVGIRYGLITGDQDARERKYFMDAFQEGKIKYILCTIQAGGTGITLTKADTMVFLQRSYSMIDNIQAEGRAHRIGSEQHESINIVDYITEGTVDGRVIEAIENKKDALEFILRDDDLTKEVFGDGENVDFSDVDLSGGDSDFGSETQFD
jgi:SNF2 family DNA or RNA helicase